MYLNQRQLATGTLSGAGEVSEGTRIPNIYESQVTQLHQRQLNQGIKLPLKPIAGIQSQRGGSVNQNLLSALNRAPHLSDIDNSYRSNNTQINESRLKNHTSLLLVQNQQERFASHRQYSDILYSQSNKKQGTVAKLMKKQEHGMLSERFLTLANSNSSSTLQTTNASNLQIKGPYYQVSSPKNVDSTISNLLEPSQQNSLVKLNGGFHRNRFSTIGNDQRINHQKGDGSTNTLISKQNRDAINLPNLDLKLPSMTRSRIQEKTELDNNQNFPKFRQSDSNSVDNSVQHTSRSILMDYSTDALKKFQNRISPAQSSIYRSRSVLKTVTQGSDAVEKILQRAKQLQQQTLISMSRGESKLALENDRISILDESQNEKQSPRTIVVDDQEHDPLSPARHKLQQKLIIPNRQTQSILREREQPKISILKSEMKPQNISSPIKASHKERETRNASNYRSQRRDYVPNWESQSKQGLFPVKKFDVFQFIKVGEGTQIRSQIDTVIDSKLLSHYNFEDANFRYIEKTVNFDSKLEQIDDIIRKELIDGTMDSITPQYIICQ